MKELILSQNLPKTSKLSDIRYRTLSQGKKRFKRNEKMGEEVKAKEYKRQCQCIEVNSKVSKWFYLARSKNLLVIGLLLKERVLMFAKELGLNNLYLFFLQPFQEFVALDEGFEITCDNDAEHESAGEPDLTTAIISHREARDTTPELLFFATSTPSQYQTTDEGLFSNKL